MGIYVILLILAGDCLDRASTIEFAREARCFASLDVQKKSLDDLKHSHQQIYGKDHCRVYTYRCDLKFILNYSQSKNNIAEFLFNSIVI